MHCKAASGIETELIADCAQHERSRRRRPSRMLRSTLLPERSGWFGTGQPDLTSRTFFAYDKFMSDSFSKKATNRIQSILDRDALGTSIAINDSIRARICFQAQPKWVTVPNPKEAF